MTVKAEVSKYPPPILGTPAIIRMASLSNSRWRKINSKNVLIEKNGGMVEKAICGVVREWVCDIFNYKEVELSKSNTHTYTFYN